MLANYIPTTFLTCDMQRKRVWELTTPQHRQREIRDAAIPGERKIYTLLPRSPPLGKLANQRAAQCDVTLLTIRKLFKFIENF